LAGKLAKHDQQSFGLGASAGAPCARGLRPEENVIP